LHAIDVSPQLPPEALERQARLLLQQIASNPAVAGETSEILLMTDVFGATPCNVAQKLTDHPHIRCVTGVNVPMLWRTLNYLHEPLDQLVARALTGGAQGVMQIANARPQNQPYRPTHDQDHRHHQQ
jgi:PTS system ascorbate-specific IIA component